MKKFIVSSIILCILFINVGCSKKQVIDFEKCSQSKFQESFTLSNEVGNLNTPTSNYNKSILADYKLVSENNILKLYINENTTCAAVLDKRNGSVYYTAIPKPEDDKTASDEIKSLMASTLKINYVYNNTNKETSNFSCIQNGKFEMKNIQNGIMITYFMIEGNLSFDDLPRKISDKRFKSFFINNDKLTEADKIRISNYFEYNDQGKYWEMMSDADSTVENLFDIMQRVGYTDAELKKDNDDFNIKTKSTNRIYFTIPLQLTLDAESLIANIDLKNLKYNKQFPPLKITVLEYMGAVRYPEKGYIFVPDGSGALINFSDNEKDIGQYRSNIYGYDYTNTAKENIAAQKETNMPIFGLKHSDGAMFAVIEDSDALAEIAAYKAGTRNGYNTVHADFTLTQSEFVKIGDGSVQSLARVYQEKIYEGSVRIRYAFLAGEDKGYNEMAQYYRKYLMSKHGIKEKGLQDFSFNMQIIGAVNGQKNLFGFSYSGIIPLTTFNEAEKISAYLQAQNISSIRLKYSGWVNGGIKQTLLNDIRILPDLGGKKGLHQFLSFAAKNNIKVYMNSVLLSVPSNSKGLNIRSDAALTLSQTTAKKIKFDMVTNREKSSYILVNAFRASEIAQLFSESIRKIDPKANVAFEDYGNTMYSNYNKKNCLSRQDSSNIQVQSIKNISKNSSLLLTNPIADAAFAADFITNAPSQSNANIIFSQTVPFYSLVFNGILQYSGESYNSSPDKKRYLLNAIETGVEPYFTFFHESNSVLKSGEYSYLMSNNFDSWKDEAVSAFRYVKNAMSGTEGSNFFRHTIIQNGVTLSEYSNRIKIYVNYTDKDVTADGQTIPAKGYVSVKGAA